jgi:hypothetical protein
MFKNGVEIQRAVDDGCRGPWSCFRTVAADTHEVLPLSSVNDPLPQLLVEEWSGPAAMAKVERLRGHAAPTAFA